MCFVYDSAQKRQQQHFRNTFLLPGKRLISFYMRNMNLIFLFDPISYSIMKYEKSTGKSLSHSNLTEPFTILQLYGENLTFKC